MLALLIFKILSMFHFVNNQFNNGMWMTIIEANTSKTIVSHIANTITKYHTSSIYIKVYQLTEPRTLPVIVNIKTSRALMYRFLKGQKDAAIVKYTHAITGKPIIKPAV